MPRVRVHLVDGLEDLPLRNRGAAPLVTAPCDATIMAIIEDLGIPHTEVGCVQVNGRPSTVSTRPSDGDEVTVHRLTQDAAPGDAPPRFLLDVHLGRLARLLRLLGFDTVWSRDAADAELASTACREDRILLSRDRGLLKRREVRRGCLIGSQDPRLQLAEAVERYGLCDRLAPFSRCMVCNAPLSLVESPPGRPDASSRGRCTSCGRRYWRGSHWTALSAIVEEVRAGERRAAPDHPFSTARM